MALSDWRQAAATGFTDVDAIARYIGDLKPTESVPRWLKRMAARVGVRLREMLKAHNAASAAQAA